MTAVVVLWLVIGIGLLLFELRHLAFYALFGSIGAFAAAVVALIAPGAIVAQGIVAVGVAVLGVAALRPYVSRALHRGGGGGRVAIGVHGGLVGAEALTLDDVGDSHAVGHVRLAGERWLACSGAGAHIPPNTRVVVTAVQGTTLVVWPVDEDDRLPDHRPSSNEDTPGEA